MSPLPFDWPTYLQIIYWLGFAVSWRTITGHWAWSVHRTAKTNPTIRPPVENWIGAAVPAFFLATIWFVVLWFVMPWPLKRGDERVGETELKGLQFKELEAANEQKFQELVSGDVLTDETGRPGSPWDSGYVSPWDNPHQGLR